MTSREHIEGIIRRLEEARKRPAMYLYTVDGRSALNFTSGVWVGAAEFDEIIYLRRDRWWKAQINRGWKMQSTGPLPQMEEKKFTDIQMADEILAIEIDTWKLILQEVDTFDTIDAHCSTRWTSGLEITTVCKYNFRTKTCFDIFVSDVIPSEDDTLVREFVALGRKELDSENDGVTFIR
jgi:hypothetical protein